MRVLFGALLLLVLAAALLGAVAITIAAIAHAVTAIARKISEVLLVFGRILLATVIACGFALAASLTTASFRSEDRAFDPSLIVLLATIVIWVVAFGILQWKPTSPNAFAALLPPGTRHASAADSRSSQSMTRTLRPLNDRELQEVWTDLQPLVGSRANSVHSALVKCGDFAARAAGAPHELLLADWAIVVRRRIPELVKAVLENVEAATDSERIKLFDDLNDDLQQIAKEAERRLNGVAESRKTRLSILRRYVASRTGREAGCL